MATHGENSIKLQSLTDKHRQVASLLAQGLGRGEISRIIDFTPEYVTWLTRDPAFKQYLQEMSEHTEARLEAMFEKTADTIADGMLLGTMDERLKAARMQLEVTGRVGRAERQLSNAESSLEKLQQLAERLIKLQSNIREGRTFDGTAAVVEDETAAERGLTRPTPTLTSLENTA